MEKIILTTPTELTQLIGDCLQRALQSFSPTEQAQTGKRYLTITEAADYLNLAKQTVYGFTSSRRIPFIKRAKRLLFLKSDLDTWLAEGTKQSRAQIKAGITGRRAGV